MEQPDTPTPKEQDVVGGPELRGSKAIRSQLGTRLEPWPTPVSHEAGTQAVRELASLFQVIPKALPGSWQGGSSGRVGGKATPGQFSQWDPALLHQRQQLMAVGVHTKCKQKLSYCPAEHCRGSGQSWGKGRTWGIIAAAEQHSSEHLHVYRCAQFLTGVPR